VLVRFPDIVPVDIGRFGGPVEKIIKIEKIEALATVQEVAEMAIPVDPMERNLV